MTESTLNTTKVQLFISCRKLKNVEWFSVSDPFVEVFEKRNQDSWIKLGQTEVIWDNLNPDFATNFILDYYFEEQKYLRFSVFDANMENNKEVKGRSLGSCECTLGEIIGTKGQQLIMSLVLSDDNKPTGTLIAKVEEISNGCNEEISFQISAKNLDNTSCWYYLHTTAPIFYLSRAMENGLYQRVYSSEYIIGTNVIWKTINKSIQDLCNGDWARPILFELYDHYRSGNNDFIGSFEFNLLKITEEGAKDFEIINPKKTNTRNYKNSGIISISSIQIFKMYSFLDYIAGGCQINLLIAIDFTGSNGNPNSPSSLHYINPNGYNHYQLALHAVSDILLNYDTDKQVPVYGFGGRINGNTSHCFPLNFNEQDPSVYGIDGIMNSYRDALRVVELNGPTLFAQIISNAVIMAENAQVNQINQQYFILLILTDGEIHDMKETIDWIVRGSNCPLNIVIVGIGKESFSNMNILDADNEPLIDSKGRKMLRDIVQFVPFKEFGNSPYALAKEVLAEIPREIANFFKIKAICPNPHIAAPQINYENSSILPNNDSTNVALINQNELYNNPVPVISNIFNSGSNPSIYPQLSPGNCYTYDPPNP